jgi:hypothetical protein
MALTPTELRAAMFCGAAVTLSADQTAADYSSLAPISWGSELYDTNAWHDAGSPTRLTVPSGLGITKVFISAVVVASLLTNATVVAIELLKDGSGAFDGAMGQHNIDQTQAYNYTSMSGIVPVTAGSYFQVQLVTPGDSSITLHSLYSSFRIQAVG